MSALRGLGARSVLAGDGEYAGLDELLKTLVRFVHDEKSAFDDSPFFLYLGIGCGEALCSNVFGLGDYLLCLLLDIGEKLLGLFIAPLHVFKICIDRELRRLKQAADLC